MEKMPLVSEGQAASAGTLLHHAVGVGKQAAESTLLGDKRVGNEIGLENHIRLHDEMQRGIGGLRGCQSSLKKIVRIGRRGNEVGRSDIQGCAGERGFNFAAAVDGRGQGRSYGVNKRPGDNGRSVPGSIDGLDGKGVGAGNQSRAG